MNNKIKKERVVIRKDNREVFLIFPDESFKNNYKTAYYTPKEGLNTADYNELIKQSKPATLEEWNEKGDLFYNINDLKYRIIKKCKIKYTM